MGLRDFVTEHGAHGAIGVLDLELPANRSSFGNGGLRGRDETIVERFVEAVVLLLCAVDVGHSVLLFGRRQNRREVDALRLPVHDRIHGVQHVDAPDHLPIGTKPERRHDLACLLGDHEEVVDHVLRLALELLPKVRILSGDSYRAGVQMAFAHHDAAHGDERRGA